MRACADWQYADVIATKCRDFVYSEDASDGAASLTSGSTRMDMEFDPLKLKRRIEDNIKCKSDIYASSRYVY